MTIQEVRNQMLKSIDKDLEVYKQNCINALDEEKKQILLHWEQQIDNMIEYMRQQNLLRL